MILVIGDNAKDLISAIKTMKEKRGECAGFLEKGRILLPIDPGKRKKLEAEGLRGRRLAKEAKEVYLLRGGKMKRIK